jgi:hypothetical protein
MKKFWIYTFFLLAFLSCKQPSATAVSGANKPKDIPAFNSDSAYKYVKAQVDFGPRVPNSSSHKKCAVYLSQLLKNYGAVVYEQKMNLTAFDGTALKSVNIIGAFNPDTQKRIALYSHWDCRPFCDQDPDPANYHKPVDGANDGASGVGILLEIARQLGQKLPNVGVDIVFFDAEDYGATENSGNSSEETWCLGSQYWSKTPHVQGYKANFGILLDMVGAPGAKFYKEQYSLYYAGNIVEKVWSTAAGLGFGQYFIDEKGGGITDDHIYVNKLAGIPSVDIIQYDPNSEHGFGSYWHTTNDTMENIDKNTLYAVGTTLLNVIYNE